MVSEDKSEQGCEWVDLPSNETLNIRMVGGSSQILIKRPPSSDTLQPGMATKCGPAMRAAIMERAKKLL